MKIIYLFFTALLSLGFLSYLFVDPNFYPLKEIYSGFAFSHRTIVSLAYLTLVGVIFLLYWKILKSFESRKINVTQAKTLISGSVIILFFSYPAMLSYDIFNYLTTAKLIYHYGENPYLVMPIEFIGDPNLLFTHAANKLALYVPSWIFLTGAPYILGFGNVILQIVGLKFLNVIFYALSLFLILRLSKDFYRVLFFGLNPLILIETFLSGHNDIVMVSLALLAFYLVKEEKILLALPSIALSVLIKYATLILLPLFAYVEYLSIRRKEIGWDRVYVIASCSMMFIFFLSFLREEIYPWYAIWFFIFVALSENKFLRGLSLVLTLFLLFRYLPFMYTGSHFGYSPVIKSVIIALPVASYVIYYFIRVRNSFSK